MHKKDLINSLRRFVIDYGTTDQVRWRGQKTFAEFLIMYLTGLNIPHDEKYDFWEIEPYLPQLMVGAFEHLRTGTDQATVRFRQLYEVETGHEVPNITDLGVSSLLDQGSAVQTTLGFVLKDITGREGIGQEIDA